LAQTNSLDVAQGHRIEPAGRDEQRSQIKGGMPDGVPRQDPRSASPVQASLARDIFSASRRIIVGSRPASNDLATRSHCFHGVGMD